MPMAAQSALVEQAPDRTPSLVDLLLERALAEGLPEPRAAAMPAVRLPAKKPSATRPMLATLLGGAADVISTQQGLASGGREMNPLLPQNRVGNALMLGGAHAGAAMLAKLLNDHGHDKLAKVLGYGTGAVGAAAAAHNYKAFAGR